MSTGQRADLMDFIRHLVTAMATATLYSPQHRQVSRLREAALASLRDALNAGPDISLMLVDEELIFDGTPLTTSMHVVKLTQAMKARGLGHLKIRQGIGDEEVMRLITQLAKSADADTELISTEYLRFGKVQVRFGQSGEGEWEGAEILAIPELGEIPDEERFRFEELYDEARRHNKLNVKGISEIVTSFIQTFSREADPLLTLAPLRALDEYTFTHSTNVCVLNLAQAMAMGISGARLHDIGIAAMLHDIGKVFIPEEILNKAGKLDETEWELMQQHPLKGAQHLLDTPGVPRLAVVTAFEHHLKYDFTGYPKVAAGWEQNLCSQMTTISDVFDALRTKRAYRGAMDYEKISAILLEMAGTELHPTLTRNFLKVLGRVGLSITAGG
ncbi:HD family phosphohydrolase [Desulfuromonas versatilis]|uniref:HD family phosphohydrolase n=2 Tax=Desulfuromonas versatilis TaxID=2802975 RepID=A0ABM8HSZ7_9BACT|nr:HD family phosphohydrolase [Desulfuromonas versatilis]